MGTQNNYLLRAGMIELCMRLLGQEMLLLCEVVFLLGLLSRIHNVLSNKQILLIHRLLGQCIWTLVLHLTLYELDLLLEHELMSQFLVYRCTHHRPCAAHTRLILWLLPSVILLLN